MLEILDLVTVLDIFSHDQIHTKAHTESEQSHLACTTNQELLHVNNHDVDASGHVMISGDVEMSSGEEVVNNENLNLQHVPQLFFSEKIRLFNHSCSRPNPMRHSYDLHEDESPLNSSRETCARGSQLPVFLWFLPVKKRWRSVRVAWSVRACVSKKKRLVLKWATPRLPPRLPKRLQTLQVIGLPLRHP